jgi:putative ABC transport system substrate-binding protein
MSIAQSTEAAYREAFAATGPGSPDAIIISEGAEVTPHRWLIAELAIVHRIPTMFPVPRYNRTRRPVDGLWQRFGGARATIGRTSCENPQGAKPGDIPIEQTSRFGFVINLKTAGAIGFTFPPAAIAQADEVIE